ncbi:MAG: response regulator [Rubritalea sp.]|uniref:response regulator n=1 Tax=Rubritalea sp. TaxID=2109375 RepID=UPI003242A352
MSLKLRTRHPLPLWIQLSVVLGGLSLVLIFLGSHILQAILLSNQEQGLKAQNRRLAEVFSAVAAEAIISEDIEILESAVLEIALKEPGLNTVQITNEDYKPLVEWRREGGQAGYEYLFEHSDKVIFMGETFGYFSTGWDISEQRQAVIEKYKELRWVIGVTLAIYTAIILLSVHYLLTRPLTRLHKKLTYLTVEGRPAQEIPHGSLEIYQLSQALDELRKSIKQSALRERMLAEAKQSADEASSAKSDFLATVSHEIRTPINGILGFTEVLLKSDLPKEENEYLQLIDMSGKNLLTIINDILDFSRIESRQLELEEVDYDLEMCIKDTLNLYSKAAASKKIELHYQIDEGVERYQKGDASRLGQVLVNLISNAIKFTDKGFISVKVSSLDAGFIKITVNDTGIGFDPAISESLFAPFQQADVSTTREYGGTGLGLAICRQLIEAMGGSISATSSPGRGSTFVLRLPSQKATSDFDSDPRVSHMKGLRVLVVDDYPSDFKHVRWTLEQWGAEVILAENFGEASRVLRDSELIDCVIIDIIESLSGHRQFIVSEQEKSAEAPPMLAISPSRFEVDEYVPELKKIAKVIHRPLSKGALLKSVLSSVSKAELDKKESISQPIDVANEGGLCALVVEDNPVNAKLTQLLLKKLGFTSKLATNGQEAIDMLQEEHSFSCVLMDIQMPVMDGIEATKKIREGFTGAHNTGICIIAVTANAYNQDKMKCIEVGMNSYIAKPFDLKRLKAVLTDHIDIIV